MLPRVLLWFCLSLTVTITCGNWVPPNYDICDREQCKLVDKILNERIDFEVEPCDDFFAFGCKKNEFSSTDYVARQTIDLEAILMSPDSAENDQALKLEKDIYQKCRDSKTIYNPSAKVRYHQMLKYEHADRLDFNYNYDRYRSNEPWSHHDLNYALKGFGFAFFDIDIVEDGLEDPLIYNGKKRYIQISPTSDDIVKINDLLTIEYIQKGDLYKHNHSYNLHSQHDVDKKYADLKKFITDFTKIIPSTIYSDDGEDDSIQMKRLVNWQRDYNQMEPRDKNSKIDFVKYIKELFDKVGIKIQESEVIKIKYPKYFNTLTHLISRTSRDTIENYIHLRFVSKTIGFVVEEYKNQYSIIPPIKGLECTPGLFIATAYQYVQRYFPKDTRDAVKTIFDNVRSSINSQLGDDKYNYRANSDITKNFLRQLETVKLVIGYPDWLLPEHVQTIAEYYPKSHFDPSELYYGNQMYAVENLLTLKLMPYKIHKLPIIDIDVIYKSFSIDNWEVPRDLKQLLIPIKVFSENNYKFVSARLHEPINYGAFGSVLASELYYTWLTRIGYAQNITQCIKDQLPKVSDEFNVKAISYILGLRSAYDANPLKLSVPIAFPEFGTETSEKIFFYSFALSLCRWESDKINMREKEDFMNFAVANMKEFDDVFVCKRARKHRLSSRKKCNPLNY